MNNNINSNINSNEKFCTRCGKKFQAIGREVICPSCKEQAAEESKKAAVLKAKRASWNGESVPVRISGRASTVIRRYGAANNLPFAQALDELLKSSDYFKGIGIKWEDVEPYKSRRRSKHATEDEQASKQDAPQAVQEVKTASKPQDAPQAAQAAKVAGKVTMSTTAKKTAGKAAKTVKTTAGKAAGKGGKA